ncbi:kinesin-like protein KIFC2 [Sphaerodactylus townsendi]|uniref:kinesin-like protein KIFC2 n=1 Tax=Sphaerodactylus townsendi TaxID=933632 RepID=UPI002026DCDE|nr:kinesin-like protein KIFC2 [Sphaerodactylus townsendi]
MYAFYSLLVYIFYTLFRKDAGGCQDPLEAEEAAEGSQPRPAARRCPRGATAFHTEPPKSSKKPPHKDLWTELTELDSSSESEGGGSTEEEEDEEGPGWGPLCDAPTPLTEFRALKEEAAAKLFLAEIGSAGQKTPESPLFSVMSHLLSFLEHYAHLQQLQEKAGEYRSRLRKEEGRRCKQLRGLKRAYRQRVKDKLSLIESLEGIISEQQGLLEKTREGMKLPSACLLYPVAPVGVHQLVESIGALQGERSQLVEEVAKLRQQVEEREKEKRRLAGGFCRQIQDLKHQIQEREEELERLRLGRGVTDSEKRIHNLTVENEGLKQSLEVTQGLLQQLVTVSAQPPAPMAKQKGIPEGAENAGKCKRCILQSVLLHSSVPWKPERSSFPSGTEETPAPS